MQHEIMFAGFGGQGILLSGKILANAAMQAGLEVAWVPSYGPEMRGGTAYCTVVIGERPIGSPIIKNPGHLVAMNQPSLEKFAPVVKAGGVVLVNESLIHIGSNRDDVDELRVPCFETAQSVGNPKAANIVALGSFVARSEVVPFENLAQAVEDEFYKKKKFIPLNLAALEKSREIGLAGKASA